MRRILKLAVCIVLLLPSLLAIAQTNGRIVKGVVLDEGGSPVPSVVILAEGGSKYEPNPDGSFSIQVPFQCRHLEFSAPFYHKVTMEVDGSFLYVKMQFDKEAKEAVEKERLALEERARKEIEDRRKAEEKARLKAERDAQRSAKLERRDSLYNATYSNRGVSHSVSISYAYELNEGQMRYLYSGWRSYGALHPIEVDYTISYKFNRIISLGGGLGVLYNTKSITIIGDEFVLNNPDSFKERRLDIPLCLSAKANFLRTSVRPFICAMCGVYCLSGEIKCDAGVGCEIRIDSRKSIDVQVQLKTVPWPRFGEGVANYTSVFAPGMRIGFIF